MSSGRELRERTYRRSPLTDDQYTAWRRTIPFTDQEIAAALEAEAVVQDELEHPFIAQRYRKTASWVLAGHLSAKVLSLALPRLVQHCALCGKTAHYRLGTQGRCSQHRDVSSTGMEMRRAALNAQSDSIEDAKTARRIQREERTRSRSFDGRRRRRKA